MGQAGIFWASLTPFSLAVRLHDPGLPRAPADAHAAALQRRDARYLYNRRRPNHDPERLRILSGPAGAG